MFAWRLTMLTQLIWCNYFNVPLALASGTAPWIDICIHIICIYGQPKQTKGMLIESVFPATASEAKIKIIEDISITFRCSSLEFHICYFFLLYLVSFGIYSVSYCGTFHWCSISYTNNNWNITIYWHPYALCTMYVPFIIIAKSTISELCSTECLKPKINCILFAINKKALCVCVF